MAKKRKRVTRAMKVAAAQAQRSAERQAAAAVRANFHIPEHVVASAREEHNRRSEDHAVGTQRG